MLMRTVIVLSIIHIDYYLVVHTNVHTNVNDGLDVICQGCENY